MKKLMIIAMLSCAVALADEWQPMLEQPQSGDKVVLNDKTYVLLSEADFELLTNKVNILVGIAHKQWNNQHKTEQGRREWHGDKTTTTFTTNGVGRITKTVEYSDGYKHVEDSVVRESRPVNPVANRRTEIRREMHKTDIPKRLRDARKGVNVTKEVK